MSRWICLECRWIGSEIELVQAKDPWGDSIYFCPKCHTPEHITDVCDEPGCNEQATCGFPTETVYRRTCGDHYRKQVA